MLHAYTIESRYSSSYNRRTCVSRISNFLIFLIFFSLFNSFPCVFCLPTVDHAMHALDWMRLPAPARGPSHTSLFLCFVSVVDHWPGAELSRPNFLNIRSILSRARCEVVIKLRRQRLLGSVVVVVYLVAFFLPTVHVPATGDPDVVLDCRLCLPASTFHDLAPRVPARD